MRSITDNRFNFSKPYRTTETYKLQKTATQSPKIPESNLAAHRQSRRQRDSTVPLQLPTRCGLNHNEANAALHSYLWRRLVLSRLLPTRQPITTREWAHVTHHHTMLPRGSALQKRNKLARVWGFSRPPQPRVYFQTFLFFDAPRLWNIT